MAGNYLGIITGIVFVVLGRRVLNGKPEASRKDEAARQSSIVLLGNKLFFLSLGNQHTRE